MYSAGDIIENPVTGERIAFVHTAAETNGDEVVFETSVEPGGFVAMAHVHPHQEERFHILEGNVWFRAGKKTFWAGPGEEVVVPAGTPHKFWNAGTEKARFICEVRPALHFEDLVGTMFALAADGKTNRKGMPNPLRLAVIASAYADTGRLAFPPAILQRVGLGLAAPIGRLLGYGSTYSAAGSTDRPGPFSTTAEPRAAFRIGVKRMAG
jgi:mannose-6-phosphate isomerase-like protein (cupin superfamily)